MSNGRSIVVAVGAVLAAAGLAFAATGRERNEAIYPEQKIPIQFSHAKHLEEGADCVACHDGARKSVKAADVLTPKANLDSEGKLEHPECESCHDIDAALEGKKVDPPADCSTCHIGYEKGVSKGVVKTSFPTPNLIFNHKAHIDRKIECGTCHFSSSTGTMDEVGLATRFQLPKMETCLQCHNGATAPSECRTCHLTDPSGRIQLSFASAVLRPMQGDPLGLDHGPRYEFTHGTRAKLDRLACAECHADKFCTKCHDSMQKPLSIHPNDYITLHPIQAKMDSMNCQSCHRYQSFCAACHERVGIGFNSDPSLRARNLSVHGDYTKWVQAGPDNHAVAAARDISTCAACHREETCTACHTSNVGIGSHVNPHGSGFCAIAKNLARANSRGCEKCHSSGDLSMQLDTCK